MFSSEKPWCQLCDYLSMKCQKEGVTFQAEAKVWLQNVVEKQEALFFEIFFRAISSSLSGLYQSFISFVTTYNLGRYALSVNIAGGTQVMTLKRRFLRALPNTTATDELQTILRRKWPCQSFSCPADIILDWKHFQILLHHYSLFKENASVIMALYLRSLIGIELISSKSI